MSKKISFIIVGLCTIISVTIMVVISNTVEKTQPEQPKSQVIKYLDLKSKEEKKKNYSINNVDKKDEIRRNGQKEKEQYKKSSFKSYEQISNVESVKQNLKLTPSEKELLLSKGRKFSATDYEKIKVYLEQKNEVEGVRKALDLFKDKLSETEYNKLKNAVNRFCII